MWRGCYGKEPFDLRLTVLRMFYQLPVIAGVTLLGTLLFGGGYYVKNVLLQGERQYAASSVYRVEYAVEEEKDVGSVYINQVSWNTYIQTEMFLDAVQAHLADTDNRSGKKEELSNQELAESLEAFLASDLRMPSTTVTTGSAEESVRIAKAVEAAMTQEFAEEIREILSVQVIDSPDAASEVVPDVRVGRAFGLSAVLSCFFAIVILLLKETGDDSIWLPATLWKRYGLRTLGTIESRELDENIRYFFEAKKAPQETVSQKAASQKKASQEEKIQKDQKETWHGKVAVCTVQKQMDPKDVLERLRPLDGKEWLAAPSPLLCPEVCETLREADGILLAVRAGRHAGKQVERVLEYLAQQDCEVTAAILWDADERLIQRYYWDVKA